MHMNCCNQNQKYDSQRSVYLRWHIEEARAVYIILLMLHHVLDDQNFPLVAQAWCRFYRWKELKRIFRKKYLYMLSTKDTDHLWENATECPRNKNRKIDWSNACIYRTNIDFINLITKAKWQNNDTWLMVIHVSSIRIRLIF